jgi:hypothetical protein
MNKNTKKNLQKTTMDASVKAREKPQGSAKNGQFSSNTASASALYSCRGRIQYNHPAALLFHYSAGSTINNSMRRFFARPSCVVVAAIGRAVCFTPKRNSAIPFCIKWCNTFRERPIESS